MPGPAAARPARRDPRGDYSLTAPPIKCNTLSSVDGWEALQPTPRFDGRRAHHWTAAQGGKGCMVTGPPKLPVPTSASLAPMPEPKRVVGYDPATSVEVSARRDRFATVFANADGSETAKVA